jgi:hypothetical protein
MKGIDSSFVPVGFSKTGTKRLKNWSGKCEGLGGEDRRVNEPEWEMGRIDEGDRRVKEPEWEMGRIDGGDRQVKELEWEMRRIRRGGGSIG